MAVGGGAPGYGVDHEVFAASESIQGKPEPRDQHGFGVDAADWLGRRSLSVRVSWQHYEWGGNADWWNTDGEDADQSLDHLKLVALGPLPAKRP
jgi:hypothetical protein